MTETAHRQNFRLMLDQKVPMRDGVNLSADVWLPLEGGPFPAALVRTIYDNQAPRYIHWARAFVDAGYAAVLQDSRGRGDSDGVWDPYICEVEDGFDTHEWVGTQPWCNGRIGTFGSSYCGFTQTIPATLRSRYLKALVPIASQQDNYGHHRVDGVIELAISMFFLTLTGRSQQAESLSHIDTDALHRRLPLISALDDIADCPYYRGVVEHERYDEWWDRYSLRERYGEVDVPAYFITGWYDSLLHETFKVFNGWRKHARSDEARRLTKLLVGPWSHQVAPWSLGAPGRKTLGPNGEYADVAFGADAAGDIVAEHLRWYDARLKGIDNGMDGEPPIRLFVMGENRWRFENEWPLARTQWTDFYLGSNGTLSPEEPADGPPDRFVYDPEDPVPSLGAQYQMIDRCGPRDRREIEHREDVLVYTSAPLEAEVEVTGPVMATVYAASSARDTDFTAALVDVHPDGKAIALCEGICRARFRNGTDSPSLITPGEVNEYRIDMWDTSNVFRKGHRIRVEVSSSNFPRYDRNLNTGGRIGYESEMQVAEQTVLHDASRPSRVTLPVVPRA